MSILAFSFRVSLDKTKPAIWRRIHVPCDYSFWDLHVAIQDAMGWLDCHLHMFNMIYPATGLAEEIGIPDEELEFADNACLAGWDVPIALFFMRAGDTAKYTYDFGDDWVHTVKLEKIIEIESAGSTLACVAGARACPPENCGGVHGYEHLLTVLKNPKHPEHKDMVQWIGKNIDPVAFDPAQVKFDDPMRRWKIAFDAGE